jgi:DNA (cytosine-5)-methyltransferase 1
MPTITPEQRAERVIVDAFHGAGGWAEAIAKLSASVESLREVARVGIEIDVEAAMAAHDSGHDVRLADVAELHPRELAEVGCEGFIASPPCPGLSGAGLKRGLADLPLIRQVVADLAQGRDTRSDARPNDHRSLLTAEPMRWVAELEPRWVMLEQVPAALPVWQDMVAILRTRGYSAWAGVLNAECYGVPQQRQRAILLASRDRRVAEPEATHRRYYPPRHRASVDPPDAHLPLWRSMADEIEHWSPSDLIGFARRNDRDDGHTHRVRDLRFASLPAFTLTEKVRSWKRVHDGEELRVSVDDAAQLQGFPRGYTWQGSRTRQFHQIANAIPVGLAQACLREVAVPAPVACAA